ncbi:DNA repair ATPase [Tahibacter harae]|uniref:DNA repair ATPase n=1 Tax=Tahibacter harae TaxID=2963937 RepID=A0ABT1QUS2_9GAMM|nr:DNA repair ATPase [Tahibacter harae]MCQ4166033.1 DNA repair ATPase [Tahibacter harae]
MSDSATFELLRKRLVAAAETLHGKAEALNARRVEAFGRVESRLAARLAARTENNCVARDIVRVGEVLLFGYNVFIGLKKETAVGDVFCLYRLDEGAEGQELVPLPLEGSFLADARFAADFRELFTYYRATTLDQLRVLDERLLLVFRTGSQAGDKRVFRFAIERDGKVSYIDNRGDREHVLPPSHDFEWTPVTREQYVLGRHPHINVLDSVFVETVAGDLTIKVENNTETGLGIYSEPVEDRNQSLADAEVAYADLRSLILLRVKPYREDTTRYLVFNKRLKSVVRIDEIGASCLQLPEDHGLVFPGGYYLESGDFKRFAELGHDFSGYRIKRHLRAPSGEDMLYVFYEPVGGSYALLSYNLIERSMSQPLLGNGYARFADGRVLLITPEAPDQASRLHTMQLWRTPFAFEEYASAQPRVAGLLGRLGNATVVRALAELRELRRLAEDTGSRGAYERLLRVAARCSDAYPWLGEAEVGDIGSEVATLARSGREALNAYEKLERAQNEAAQLVAAAGKTVAELLSRVASLLWQKPDDFTDAIRQLKRKRGELTVMGEQPHVDGAAIAALDARLREELERIGARALKFFADPAAFATLRQGLADSAAAVNDARTTAALAPVAEKLDALAESLDGLSELIAGFEQSDAQQRAALLGETSQLYAEVNRIRAALRARRETLLVQEQGLEFGAQLTVLEQSVLNLLGRCDTPESADAGLAQVLSQIEQLEARFGEQPDFLVELTSRRESALEAFAARREQIAGQRDKRAQALKEAIGRVLDGVPRRVAKIGVAEELHAFFAGDTLIERAQRQLEELRGIGQAVAADELAGRLRALKEAGLRDLRDRNELGTSGAALALGRHRFSIERGTLDLALLHDSDGLALQLTGTDYRRRVQDARAENYRSVWGQPLPNETAQIYRAEFLAALLWRRIEAGDAALRDALRAADAQVLIDAVAAEAQRRPSEDYQRGVHDVDAAAILRELARLSVAAGELRQPAAARVLAQAWYAAQREQAQAALRAHAAGLHWFLQREEAVPLPASWLSGLQSCAQQLGFAASEAQAQTAARHLVASLGGERAQFAAHSAALDLAARAGSELPRSALAALQSELSAAERLDLARQWCARLAPEQPDVALEAGAILAFADLPRERINAELAVDVSGLRGAHARLRDGVLRLDLPEFLSRLAAHAENGERAWHDFARLRHGLVEDERRRLGLDRFLAKPMAGFVRNRLIDEVYLPLIGNNLAKQIGSVGDARSDRSGLLLLISPPGYGKTTLMEYIADRLGMIFVRVNGPTLGHEVNSLDPASVSQRGAAEELVKLNLGLAMGVNVMLYLDDIQHLSAEFLQKFISLADGTRRIDAVIDGEARTLDLRGKRFALVMAGNPYTESGEVFRIPDMLANRADVYNLGDVLSGREALFADSYIENALTANPLSAPLAERPRTEIQAVLRAARGGEEEIPAELPGGLEMLELVRRMVGVRDVLMRVNAAYVASAAQDDAYRSEPPFKLQGSYRNMVKLAAQLSPLLTPAELDSLIRDHYRGEAQTLGARAEENLLKLSQLIGAPDAAEQARWNELVENFRRLAKQGGKDADGATRMAQTLAEIAVQLEKQGAHSQGLGDALGALEALRSLADIQTSLQREPRLEMPPALNETLARMAKAYEETLLPLVSALHHKMTLDHDMWEQVRTVRTSLDMLVKRLGKS